MTVLWISEQPHMPLIYSADLAKAGYRVISCRMDPDRVVDACSKPDLEVAVIDLDAGDAPALEALHTFTERCPDVPLVLLTSGSELSPDVQQSAVAALMKPITAELLLDEIHAATVFVGDEGAEGDSTPAELT